MKNIGRSEKSVPSSDVVLVAVPVTTTLWTSRSGERELSLNAVGIREV